MLDAFLEENPDATEEDLYLALGSPEELAEQMMEECEQTDLKNSIRNPLINIRSNNILLVICLICVGVIVYMCWFSKGYTTIETKQYIYSTKDASKSPSSTITYHFYKEDTP